MYTEQDIELTHCKVEDDGRTRATFYLKGTQHPRRQAIAYSENNDINEMTREALQIFNQLWSY